MTLPLRTFWLALAAALIAMTTSCAAMEADWLRVHCNYDIARNDGINYHNGEYPRLPEMYMSCPAATRGDALKGFREGTEANAPAPEPSTAPPTPAVPILCNLDSARVARLSDGKRGAPANTDQFAGCPSESRDQALEAYRRGFEQGMGARTRR